jgi:hypothetical protein
MAEFKIKDPQMGSNDKETIKNLYDTVCRLRKELEFFSQHLDSENVTEINTNETVVKSNKGYTTIDGPMILMYDIGKHVRRKEGLDTESGNFTDEWYDADGNRTAYIDSNGKLAVVDGFFTGTVTGGTVRTAEPGKARIEMTENGISSYNASNQKEGVCVEIGQYGFSKLSVYVAGISKGGLSAGQYNSLELGTELGINLLIASGGDHDRLAGYWDCTLSQFSDLKDESNDRYATRSWVQSWVNSQGFSTSGGASGYTGDITCGNYTLTFSGGLLTSVTF